jgi:hypothetical protein
MRVCKHKEQSKCGKAGCFTCEQIRREEDNENFGLRIQHAGNCDCRRPLAFEPSKEDEFGTFCLVHASEAYRGSRCVVPHILNLDTRRGRA